MLAEEAEKLGAVAISAVAPSYFKPRTVGTSLLKDNRMIWTQAS
jgi:dihydrodipicolinate synthase/N-acetylneuraminate lyase